MAIPDNPQLTAGYCLQLSREFRALSLPGRVPGEIARYLDELAHEVDADLVLEWMATSETVEIPASEEVKTVKWAKEYTLSEMETSLRNSRRVKRGDLYAELRRLNWVNLSHSTKGDMVTIFAGNKDQRVAANYTREEVGKYLDRMIPLSITTTKPMQLVRRPDILEGAEYQNKKGSLLSQFGRGHYLRKKADLVLALLGRVYQTPQEGQGSDSFFFDGGDLADAEAQIWEARKGSGFDGDQFLNEMWFRITAKPFEDFWRLTVDYLQVYEAEVFEHTEGWPTRDKAGEGQKRDQATIEDKLRRKQDYEAWLKEKRKKARQKREAVSRKPAKKKGKKR